MSDSELAFTREAMIKAKRSTSPARTMKSIFHELNLDKPAFNIFLDDVISKNKLNHRIINLTRGVGSQVNKVMNMTSESNQALKTFVITTGIMQLITESINFFLSPIKHYQEKKLPEREELLKYMMVLVSIAALTICTFGLGGMVITGIAIAARAFSSNIKGYLSFREDCKKLKALHSEIESKKANGEENTVDYRKLCAKHERLHKTLNSKAERMNAYNNQAANVLILVGAILLFTPMAHLAAILILAGSAMKYSGRGMLMAKKIISYLIDQFTIKEAIQPQKHPEPIASVTQTLRNKR